MLVFVFLSILFSFPCQASLDHRPIANLPHTQQPPLLPCQNPTPPFWLREALPTNVALASLGNTVSQGETYTDHKGLSDALSTHQSPSTFTHFESLTLPNINMLLGIPPQDNPLTSHLNPPSEPVCIPAGIQETPNHADWDLNRAIQFFLQGKTISSAWQAQALRNFLASNVADGNFDGVFTSYHQLELMEAFLRGYVKRSPNSSSNRAMLHETLKQIFADIPDFESWSQNILTQISKEVFGEKPTERTYYSSSGLTSGMNARGAHLHHTYLMKGRELTKKGAPRTPVFCKTLAQSLTVLAKTNYTDFFDKCAHTFLVMLSFVNIVDLTSRVLLERLRKARSRFNFKHKNAPPYNQMPSSVPTELVSRKSSWDLTTEVPDLTLLKEITTKEAQPDYPTNFFETNKLTGHIGDKTAFTYYPPYPLIWYNSAAPTSEATPTSELCLSILEDNSEECLSLTASVEQLLTNAPPSGRLESCANQINISQPTNDFGCLTPTHPLRFSQKQFAQLENILRAYNEDNPTKLQKALEKLNQEIFHDTSPLDKPEKRLWACMIIAQVDEEIFGKKPIFYTYGSSDVNQQQLSVHESLLPGELKSTLFSEKVARLLRPLKQDLRACEKGLKNQETLWTYTALIILRYASLAHTVHQALKKAHPNVSTLKRSRAESTPSSASKARRAGTSQEESAAGTTHTSWDDGGYLLQLEYPSAVNQ